MFILGLFLFTISLIFFVKFINKKTTKKKIYSLIICAFGLIASLAMVISGTSSINSITGTTQPTTSNDTATADTTTTDTSTATNSTSTELSTSDKVTLWVEATDIVKDNLKSPSTAKFPFSYSDGDITEIDANTFTVTSYVDSQNSFGATLRSNFSITIIKDGDNYSYKDLSIESN